MTGNVDVLDEPRNVGSAIFIPVTNPLERLNKEVKRRSAVIGIFPNEARITRLVGAILMEQNDEWQLQHCYMTLETMTGLAVDDTAGKLPQLAAQAA